MNDKITVATHQGRLVVNSLDVAEMLGRPHWTVLRSIKVYSQYLTDNKIVVSDFFMRSTYEDETGRSLPCVLLTEKGCDFIANKATGERGAVFTALYVTAFHDMREELASRKRLRTEGKPKHRSLTDAIRDSGEHERMKGHAYTAYTNLAYKSAVGKNAAQIRKERGAEKGAVAADLLTSEELTAYQKREAAITALLDIGQDFNSIKTALLGGAGQLGGG